MSWAASFCCVGLLWGALAAAQGSPELVGPTRVVGDGRTPVTLELRVVPAGAEVQASAGRLEGVERTPEGGLRVSWVPPRVAGALEVVLSARSGPGRRPVAQWRVRVEAPAADGALPLGTLGVVRGEPVAAGEPVDVAIPAGEAGRTLRVSAGEAGTFEAEQGREVARLTPPRQGYPQPVIAALVASDGTLREWAVLPVHGLGEVEAQTEADASVTFEVGDTEFGPVRTDRAGTARMLIRAPPGSRQALAVVTDALGNVRRTPVELGVPEVRPLLLVCPRDRRHVQVLAVGADGAPARGARLSLEAEGAGLGALREVEPGRYVARLLAADVHQPLRVRAAWAMGEGAPVRCELPAEPRAAPPPAPVVPAPAPAVARRLSVAPRLGYLALAGRLSSAVALVDVGWRPEPWPWLSLSLEGGVSLARGAFSDPAVQERVDTTGWMAPLLARASLRPWEQSVAVYAGPSAGGLLVGGRMESPRVGTVDVLQALPAAGGHAGVEWRLGPGRVALEATYLHGWPGGAGDVAPLNAVLVSGGYRLEP